jgi:hypothetical protein
MKVYSDEEFAQFVRDAVSSLGVDKIADRCEVHRTTVDRWASGIAKPMPRIRAFIVSDISRMIDAEKQSINGVE